MPISSSPEPTVPSCAPPSRVRCRVAATVKALLGLTLTAAALVWGLPRAVGASWSQIGGTIAGIPTWGLVALALLWAIGICSHTIMLAAAMPGLRHRQSLLMSQTGAAVANTLPLGGAAGTAVNFSMVRRWGFTGVDFARYAMVTNLWDTLFKLGLPVLAVTWLGATSPGENALFWTAMWSLLLLAAVVAGAGVLLRSDRLAHAAGHRAGRLAVRAGREVDPAAWARRAGEMRWDTAGLVARAWPRLTAGKVLYVVLQTALLGGCLLAVGASVDPAVVFAAYAAQQVLSLASLTPGAAGVVEVGMAGVLVALGVPAPAAAAGILVYRGFTFALEIPVGGSALVWWLVRGRHRAVSARPVPDSADVEPAPTHVTHPPYVLPTPAYAVD
ncbi:lysylphosphatidylglycerol synthase transmembrane domain-containing protein [Luteipulveratus sp. YIM 133132]|uniref:lysylphosphatidylglycerol synthase transmembrane domain-containing protein n=1 Tax=Luteipulveratus flavus TaxID=3031728 RepID=UPI0023AF0941|nr:lysylphosphatidylglycerol synthase transmembrane domain-containing protein [Luteipulveratus sp. YIM 133132]MDE9366532.1 lysylphosphatidylglycerol synthase transmembrane domain-containing protein [Luteipulveratus sp. YIM 133132]